MSDPVLYVFVNTSLESMNFGKAMAQSSHAANAFVKDFIIDSGLAAELPPEDLEPFDKLFVDWFKSTPQGFGTQLNLIAPDFDAAYDDLRHYWISSGMDHCVLGEVFDPSYPFETSKEVSKFLDTRRVIVHNERGDGKVLCTRHERTAFYMFGDRDVPEFRGKMRDYKLHP